jgi:hypothetical protein
MHRTTTNFKNEQISIVDVFINDQMHGSHLRQIYRTNDKEHIYKFSV